MAVAAVTLQTAQPWEQQPGEGIKAFNAFRIYLDLGAERSTHKVAQALGKSWSLTRKWAGAHAWVERARRWDAHLEDERQASWRQAVRAPADEVADMNRRHAQMAVAVQRKALERLSTLDAADLDPRAVLAYLTEAAKLERLARGEPGDTSAGDQQIAEQEVVVQLLADPQTRLLAVQLATRAHLANGNGHQNGHSAT